MHMHSTMSAMLFYSLYIHRRFSNISSGLKRKTLFSLLLCLVYSLSFTGSSPSLGSSKPNKKVEETTKGPLRKGNAKLGKIKSSPCSACHGKTGISSISTYPHLSAQHMSYLIEQTLAIKTGARNVPEMAPTVESISEQDIIDIAAYYSAQPSPKGATKKDLFPLGQSLYRTGNKKKQQTPCSSCHSVDGSGNALAGYPKISGQSVEYLVKQLKDFRSGERSNSNKAQIMQSVAERLSDNEIMALASYINGLRNEAPPSHNKNNTKETK